MSHCLHTADAHRFVASKKKKKKKKKKDEVYKITEFHTCLRVYVCPSYLQV